MKNVIIFLSLLLCIGCTTNTKIQTKETNDLDICLNLNFSHYRIKNQETNLIIFANGIKDTLYYSSYSAIVEDFQELSNDVPFLTIYQDDLVTIGEEDYYEFLTTFNNRECMVSAYINDSAPIILFDYSYSIIELPFIWITPILNWAKIQQNETL